MSYSPREWKWAIRDVFGAVVTTPMFPNSSVAATSGEGAISSVATAGAPIGPAVPALFWGFGYSITAANTMDLRFVDASNTGVGTPVKFNISSLAAGTKSVFFDRAIPFTKGLVWVVSATGTATPQIEVFWEPTPKAGLGIV